MNGSSTNLTENIKAGHSDNSLIQSLENSKNRLLNFFASVKLTIVLLSLLGIFVLLGAWCPQISQSGEGKVFEQFGQQTGQWLINIGIAEIFHSPAFLILIGFLTVNIIFGSFKHVFPKLKLLRIPLPWLSSEQINKLPVHTEFILHKSSLDSKSALLNDLQKSGYKVKINLEQINAEKGKIGRLAPTITHIGLLTLLAGVICTSMTGFSGFKALSPGENLNFDGAEHAQLWFGNLPNWSCTVLETHREEYESGDVRQWCTTLIVKDKNGQALKEQIISVNNPLSYNGVDVYQSSWGLKGLKLRFGKDEKILPLQPMGKLFAAFLPLPDQSVLIFSVRDTKSPLKLFAKRKDWSAPKLLAVVKPKETTRLGDATVAYLSTIAQTGLQYKCDPGLPIVLAAFFLITVGIGLAAIPHKLIWAEISQVDALKTKITIGGATKKGKTTFAQQINKLQETLQRGASGQND